MWLIIDFEWDLILNYWFDEKLVFLIKITWSYKLVGRDIVGEIIRNWKVVNFFLQFFNVFVIFFFVMQD